MGSVATMSTGGRYLLQGVRNLTTHFGGATTLGDFRTPMEEEVALDFQSMPQQSPLFSEGYKMAKDEVSWEGAAERYGLDVPKLSEASEGAMYSVFRYEGVEAGICLCPVSSNQFCIKMRSECTVKKHSAPAGKPEVKCVHLEPGYYIVNPRSQQQLAAFREPSLSLAAADISDIFQLHKDERLSKEAWLSVFAAVEQQGKARDSADTAEESDLNGILEEFLQTVQPSARTPMFSRKPLEDTDSVTSFEHDELRAYAQSSQKKWVIVRESLQRTLDAIVTLKAVMGVPPKLRADQHTTLWGSVDAVAQALDRQQEEIQKVSEMAEVGGGKLDRIEQQMRERISAASALGDNVRSVEA